MASAPPLMIVAPRIGVRALQLQHAGAVLQHAAEAADARRWPAVSVVPLTMWKPALPPLGFAASPPAATMLCGERGVAAAVLQEAAAHLQRGAAAERGEIVDDEGAGVDRRRAGVGVRGVGEIKSCRGCSAAIGECRRWW